MSENIPVGQRAPDTAPGTPEQQVLGTPEMPPSLAKLSLPKKRYRLASIELNSIAFGTKRSFSSASIESEASNASVEITNKSAKLKRHYKGFMDAPYFDMMADIEDATMQMKEASAADMLMQSGQTEEAWYATTAGQDYLTTQASLKSSRDTWQRLANNIKTVEANNPLVVTWFESWIRDPKGMDENISDGGRDKREHSNWRTQLIKNYAAGSSTNPRFIWDPSLHEYKDTVVAAHIFPQKCGNGAFGVIFGDKETTSGVYHPRNGILLDKHVEERFDKGHFAIVPNVDIKDPKQVEQWLAQRPREYKVQVFRPDLGAMKDDCIDLAGNIPYNSLDGRVLKFKSEFRPTARFLAYHYLYCLVKLSYGTGARGKALLGRVGDQIWATPGKNMKRALLMPMLQQMGMENHESIFVRPLRLADRDESDVEDDDDDQDPSHSMAALQAVNNTITQDVREEYMNEEDD